ncbi:MAG: hypothetical protein VYA34_08085 [Myxococcota bacterium]|nr:hypothetical protein [Myxococcota bacterium]
MLKSTVKRIIIGMILGTRAAGFAIPAPMSEEDLEAIDEIVVDA